MKYCPKCSESKPFSAFHVSKANKDGLQAYCKECNKIGRSKYKASGKYKTAMAAWRRAGGSASEKTYHTKYINSDKGRAYKRRQRAKDKKRFPEKFKAWAELHRALKVGAMMRQPCEICGAVDGIHAHHEDYSKPLDVRWLCVTHHLKEHGKLG